MNKIVSCPICDAPLANLEQGILKCSSCGEIYTTQEYLEYLREIEEARYAREMEKGDA